MEETTTTTEQAPGVAPAPTGAAATTTPLTTEAQKPGAQAASATTQAEDPETARLKAELEKVRKEAAANRVKLKEFETAQMTETEKQAARLAELEAENQRLASVAREKAISAAVTEAASKYGVKPALAVKLIDGSKLEFDEGGGVKNAEDLVSDLVKENPELAGQMSGPGNPGRANVTTDPKMHEAELRAILNGGNSQPFSVERARANPVVVYDPESRRSLGG